MLIAATVGTEVPDRAPCSLGALKASGMR